METEHGYSTCAPLHLGSGATHVGPKPCDVAVRSATSVSEARPGPCPGEHGLAFAHNVVIEQEGGLERS